MMDYRWVTSTELGKCPAAVDMDDGVIEINRDVWDDYSDAEKAFILAHEEGHFKIPTDDECEADIYALKAIAGQFPRSLAQAVGTLFKVGVIDDDRLENAYMAALRLDAKMGNAAAAKELDKIENMENYENTTPMVYTEDLKNRKFPRRGFIIGGFYLSFEVVALAVIALLLYKLLKK